MSIAYLLKTRGSQY